MTHCNCEAFSLQRKRCVSEGGGWLLCSHFKVALESWSQNTTHQTGGELIKLY